MDDTQLQKFIKANEESTDKTVKKTINGKMESWDKKWERALPVIEAYEALQRANRDAQASGKFLLWLAGFIVAIGSAYLTVKHIILNQ